jgi:hypothetical protein
MKRFSNVDQIEHFTGVGLYDASFVQVMREIEDPMPFLRGVVAEYGFERKDIPYEQQKRKFGRTHNNWATLYDGAMQSFTSYTKVGLRGATILGFIMAFVCLCISVVYLVLKLTHWDEFNAGTAPLLIGVFFIGAVQIFFIGMVGEYIMNMSSKVVKRPLVVESKRINFD